MRATFHHPLALLSLLALAMLSGCQFKGDRAAARGEEPLPAGVWQIKPVKLRIYPSTRFVRYDGQIALEARVEFVDEMGDPLKAVGNLRFEVYAANRDGDVADQRKLFSWDVPLLTIEANQEFYDAVTRAYLFRLGIETLPRELERTVVRVIYMPVRGERMEAMAVVAVQ